MEADLILQEKNPAEDISNIQFIDKVFLRGDVAFSQKPISSYDIPQYSYPPDVLVMKYQKSDGAGTRVVDVSRYASDGEIACTQAQGDAVLSEEEFTVEGNLSCTGWSLSRPSDNTELTAKKDGDFIKLRGTFKGKPREKAYKIGDGLWYQMMDMAMLAFIASDARYVGWFPVRQASSGKTLTFDLIFEVE